MEERWDRVKQRNVHEVHRGGRRKERWVREQSECKSKTQDIRSMTQRAPQKGREIPPIHDSTRYNVRLELVLDTTAEAAAAGASHRPYYRAAPSRKWRYDAHGPATTAPTPTLLAIASRLSSHPFRLRTSCTILSRRPWRTSLMLTLPVRTSLSSKKSNSLNRPSSGRRWARAGRPSPARPPTGP